MAKLPRKPAGDYAVGYSRPPSAHQFKPGQSGNPRGRPKGQPTLAEAVGAELSRLVKIKTGDSIMTVTKRDAIIRKLAQKAMEGDMAAVRAIMMVTAAQEVRDAEEAASAVDAGSAVDADIKPDDEALRRMVKRFEHLLE